MLLLFRFRPNALPLSQELTVAGGFVRFVGEGVLIGSVLGLAASADAIAVGTDTDRHLFLFNYATGDRIRAFSTRCDTSRLLRLSVGIRFTPDGSKAVRVVVSCISPPCSTVFEPSCHVTIVDLSP